MIVDIPNVNVNLRNKQGNTPLHLAVQYEEDPEVAVSMVDILLDSGADPRYTYAFEIYVYKRQHLILICIKQNS